MSLYEFGLRGARHPPAAPGLARWHCQKSGGAGRQGPALNFYRMPVSWRPARRFLTKVLRTCRRSGLRTGPGLSELAALAQVRRAGLLPIRYPAFRQPRRSAGRTDQTAVLPRYAGAAELAW